MNDKLLCGYISPDAMECGQVALWAILGENRSVYPTPELSCNTHLHKMLPRTAVTEVARVYG